METVLERDFPGVKANAYSNVGEQQAPMPTRERRLRIEVHVSVVDADVHGAQERTTRGVRFTAHAAGYARQDVIDEAGKIARHATARAIASHLEER